MNIVGKRNLRKLLEHKARALPAKTFLIFEDAEGHMHSYTYDQFDRAVNRTANALLRLGVRKGDKVNLHLTNRPEFLLLWFANAKIGAVTVPTSTLSPPDELAYPVGHSGSVVSVTQPDLLTAVTAIRERCPQMRHVILCGPSQASDGVVPFDALVQGQPETLAEVDVDPYDDAAVLYTSGTTSRPKGAVLTQANYVFKSEVVAKTLRMGPGDRHLVALPLYHVNTQYTLLSLLNVGGSLALMPGFSASRFMKQAARHECTVANLFAAPIRMILAQPRDPADKANKLRLVTFAQNVTAAQLDEWHQRFGAPLIQIFGMTEAVGMVTANPLDYAIDNMSMGLPALGYECRVVDDLGRDVPAGVPGQLLVRGEPGLTIMKGYLKDPTATTEAVRDGWLWTGDLVEQTEEGYIRFVDRAKDMIKRAGENVATGEVEMVLTQHPSVAEAAVIGVPDAIRDEAIKAFIVLKEGQAATEDEIIAFCKQRLSKFRVPEFVEFRRDLPRTSVGKVKKYLLRREEGATRSEPTRPTGP